MGIFTCHVAGIKRVKADNSARLFVLCILLQFTDMTLKFLAVTLCTHLFFGEDVAFGAGLKWLGDVMLGSESVVDDEWVQRCLGIVPLERL